MKKSDPELELLRPAAETPAFCMTNSKTFFSESATTGSEPSEELAVVPELTGQTTRKRNFRSFRDLGTSEHIGSEPLTGHDYDHDLAREEKIVIPGKTPLQVQKNDPWNHLPTPSADNGDGLAARSEQPVLQEPIEERRMQFRRLQDQDYYIVERIALDSRVLIIEGISGSGKDTFQTYLRAKLKGRDVHDYSEGEVLQSWKQLQIAGIFQLRVKFMKRFVNYVKDVVSRDGNAVFLLNRFHLSTYASTIIKQPKLGREYDEIINVLRTLPVHVLILQLDENEIAKRSLHPERSSAWQKYQQEIVKKEGFRDTLERHIWQQGLMLEAAEKQQIPYSVIKPPVCA